MKILSAHIENFGKLSNFDLEFKEGATALFKENGFGKSTLAAFIKAMLYGMDKKGNLKAYAASRSRFKPWQGGVYGGSIIFESDKGKFKATRTFGDTPEGDTFQLIDLTSKLKSSAYSNQLGFELFGIGRETYEITAFFLQTNIDCSLNDETRAGLVGANKFENDLASFTAAQKQIALRMRELKRDKMSKLDFELKNRDLKANLNQIEALKEEINILECETASDKENLSQKKEELEKLKEERAQARSNQQTAVQPKAKRKLLGVDIFAIVAFSVITLAMVLLSVFSLLNPFIALAICLGGALVLGGASYLWRLRPNPLKQDEGQAISFDEENYEKLSEAYFEKSKDFALKVQRKNSLISQVELLQESYEDQAYQLSMLKMRNDEAEGKIELLTKALHFMDEAQVNVSKRYVQPMQVEFDKYFKSFSDENISLNVNFDVGVPSAQGEKEYEYLSAGYKDIVSLCKRFALLENIYKEEKPLIIMDDPFINFDDNNLALAKKLLQEMSKKYQILYLYCHSKNSL